MSDTRLLQDPYLDWVKDEGIPVYEDFGFDLRTLDLKPWSRVGVNAAFAFTRGRGDYLDCVVLEIPSGKSTEPQQHMYEEVVYVIDGHGSTTIDRGNGKRHSFEWGPKSLFAIPLNAKYRHFNTSGTAPARMVSTTNLPMILKLFRDTEFIFNNPYEFVGRMGEDRFFEGEGDFIPMRPGKHMWETNFVPDLSTFELKEWKDRGAGGSNIMFALAQGTMHAHMSEMPVGTYKKGHRHGADFHIFPVTGSGYSIFWFEGDKDFQRFDWEHGCVYAPEDMMFHQHFNTSSEPARYLAVAFGGLRYPFSKDKRDAFIGVDVSLNKGGKQVEYEDQDPRIHQMFIESLKSKGVEPRMDEFIK
ncbi:MAG: cupin domain-containing protein [Actinobacteria bacterium]|jgi:mannose-6-phosphate isomerase-like protein (cupin superfamily)|nr:cupin domain-containing protein [Actinomycetota bacterium]